MIDFGDLVPSGRTVSFDGKNGLKISGVKFVGGGLPHRVILASASGSPYVSSWGSSDKLLGADVEIHAWLPPGTTVVGSDIMVTFQAFIPSDAFFTVLLSTGEVVDRIISTPPPHRAFVGFVSDNPIRRVTFRSNGTFPMLANFSFGSLEVVRSRERPSGAAEIPSKPSSKVCPSSAGKSTRFPQTVRIVNRREDQARRNTTVAEVESV
jgi:hypothetical protein